MTRRLCVVVPTHWEARMGGSQYQARVLIDYLLRHYDVEIFYLTTRTKAGFVPDGYEIVRFSDRAGLRRYGFFLDAHRLYRALERLEPHVVYQQVGCAHTGIAAHYARRHGCRMVWRVSSDRSVTPGRNRWWQPHRRLERAMLDYGIRHADVIAAQTAHQRDELARHFGRLDSVVIPNFHPAARDPKHTDSAPTVLWIGNLKPLKNPHMFVRLARGFAGRPDVGFEMIGARIDDSHWTRELMRVIAATPNLRYLGELSQDEVNARLEHGHVLVNTSDFEGFSNTFVQAWMRRVPVVSLEVDPDGLLSGQGLGCRSGNEERLHRDVERFVDDPDLRRRVGAHCRDYALRRHGERNIDELARLLQLERLAPAYFAAANEPPGCSATALDT